MIEYPRSHGSAGPARRAVRSVVRTGRRRRHGRERGAALVEFALIMPLLMVMILGPMDFGYMINRDTLINNAAKEGAREGSVNPKKADIEAVVRSSLSNLNQQLLTVTVTCRKPNETACGAFDTDATTGGVVIVRVQFVYVWFSFVPRAAGLGTSKTLSKTVEMRIE